MSKATVLSRTSWGSKVNLKGGSRREDMPSASCCTQHSVVWRRSSWKLVSSQTSRNTTIFSSSTWVPLTWISTWKVTEKIKPSWKQNKQTAKGYQVWHRLCHIRWFPHNSFDYKSTLVQVMAWCLTAPSHHLNRCWPRSPRSVSPYGLIRPQWVNCLAGWDRPKQQTN